jgi:hypothetical protein
VDLSPSFQTIPEASIYYINSGEDFIFYLPSDIVPKGQVPVVSIGFTAGNEAVLTENVWATGDRLYITSAVGGEARIYNVAGVLVKTVPYIAGEITKTTLAKGVYVCCDERKDVENSD